MKRKLTFWFWNSELHSWWSAIILTSPFYKKASLKLLCSIFFLYLKNQVFSAGWVPDSKLLTFDYIGKVCWKWSVSSTWKHTVPELMSLSVKAVQSQWVLWSNVQPFLLYTFISILCRNLLFLRNIAESLLFICRTPKKLSYINHNCKADLRIAWQYLHNLPVQTSVFKSSLI